MAWYARTLNFQRIKEAVFLTAKTTAMVCWLFVGSALFPAVFALLGGQRLVEEWVLTMNLTPLQFLLPLLAHFQIDPMLWGVLVFS